MAEFVIDGVVFLSELRNQDFRSPSEYDHCNESSGRNYQFPNKQNECYINNFIRTESEGTSQCLKQNHTDK